jgi:hypothetical protein
MRRTFYLSAVLMLCASHARAQTAKEIGDTVSAYVEVIDRTFLNNDSLVLLNAKLLHYLLANLPRVPESLTTDYKLMGWVRISTTGGKKLRIWSWDDGSGGPTSGSPRVTIAVAEYQTPEGIKAQRIIPDDTTQEDWRYHVGRCDTIYTVKGKQGQMYYIPMCIFESDEEGDGYLRDVEAYAIEGDHLNTRVPLFEKSGKTMSNVTIDFECERYWEPHNFRMKHHGKVLLVPHINRHHEMTSKDEIYEFDGYHFVYKGVSK